MLLLARATTATMLLLGLFFGPNSFAQRKTTKGTFNGTNASPKAPTVSTSSPSSPADTLQKHFFAFSKAYAAILAAHPQQFQSITLPRPASYYTYNPTSLQLPFGAPGHLYSFGDSTQLVYSLFLNQTKADAYASYQTLTKWFNSWRLPTQDTLTYSEDKYGFLLWQAVQMPPPTPASTYPPVLPLPLYSIRLHSNPVDFGDKVLYMTYLTFTSYRQPGDESIAPKK